MPPSVSNLSLKMIEAICLTEEKLSQARFPVWVETRQVTGYFDALPLRDHRPPPVLVRSTSSVRSVFLMTVAFAILASLAYWADPSELFQAIQDGPNAPPLLQSGLATNTTDVETTPQLPRPTSRQPRVLRFTAFPDVIARGESLGLCYDVANGTRLRIDPDVGEVGGGRNDCVRAAPAETTTYVLTAQGEDGQSVRQTVRNVELRTQFVCH